MEDAKMKKQERKTQSNKNDTIHGQKSETQTNNRSF